MGSCAMGAGLHTNKIQRRTFRFNRVDHGGNKNQRKRRERWGYHRTMNLGDEVGGLRRGRRQGLLRLVRRCDIEQRISHCRAGGRTGGSMSKSRSNRSSSRRGGGGEVEETEEVPGCLSKKRNSKKNKRKNTRFSRSRNSSSSSSSSKRRTPLPGQTFFSFGLK